MPRQKKENSAAVLGFEDKLWQAAVLMRGKLPATQYRQVLMGLLFLKGPWGPHGWKTVNNFRGGFVTVDPSVRRLRVRLHVG